MRSTDPSSRRLSLVQHARQASTAEPQQRSESSREIPSLEEGIQHIVRSLKEGKSFREMQIAWRTKH